RADLDAGRPREAALQARIALEALLAEVGGDLTELREPVGRAANEALAGHPAPDLSEAVATAVERMEAALRRRRAGQMTNLP
ncbi:MAG: hypothetical protein M3340_15220, partial [Actinomycetota bacterium]|nr:hypothetical protein [Actinomycetota bacterium]